VNNYLEPVLEAGVKVLDILVDEAGELEMFLCPLGRLLLLSLSQASTPINIIYIFVHGIVLYNLLRPTFVLFRIRYRYLTKQNFPLSTVKAANFVTFFTLFNFFSQKYLKVTIRPDWICMRVVPLESPLK
jgi:hypothetical protein